MGMAQFWTTVGSEELGDAARALPDGFEVARISFEGRDIVSVRLTGDLDLGVDFHGDDGWLPNGPTIKAAVAVLREARERMTTK